MKKSTRALALFWLVLSATMGSPTPCFSFTDVVLKQDGEIEKAAVRLSDLFDGVPAAIDRDIALAPPACKPAVYDEIVLSKLAQTYRLDWAKRSGDSVTISSPCSRISADAIRDAVILKLKAANAVGKPNFEVSFDRRSADVVLPSKMTPSFALENFSYDPLSKKFRADLTAEAPRGLVVVPISGHATLKRTVPVLAHRLESGSVIGERDLDLIDMPDSRITADIVTEPSQLIGREMRRDVSEGEILRARDIMPPRFVQRGTLVTMKIETPYMIITAQGKAEQDGTEGDTIRVKNTQSNRVVEGVVTAPGVVEIRTAPKVVALAE